MLSPWSALILFMNEADAVAGIPRAGAGQSSHRASRLRVGRRLQISLRATLGGWDTDRPACANQRRAFGAPCSRPRFGRGVNRMNAYGSTSLFGMLMATSLVSGATAMEINQ